MKGSPKVSVIIPTYNRERYILRALQSALSQSFSDLEVIVVDDRSSDNTRELVRAVTDSRVRLLSHKCNRGASAARNTGINASRGELVAFLDSDDQWLPSKIARQVEIMDQPHQKAGAVYTGVAVVDREDAVRRISKPDLRGFSRKNLLFFNSVGITSSVLARKESLLRVGGFDASLPSCQDWDLWLRLSRYYHFESIPEALVKQLDHQANISSNKTAVIEGHMALFAKHKELYRRIIHALSFNLTRARESFSLGRRLLKFGAETGRVDAVTFARKVLLCSWLSCPIFLKSLFFYCVSLLGIKNYLKLIRYRDKLLRTRQ